VAPPAWYEASSLFALRLVLQERRPSFSPPPVDDNDAPVEFPTDITRRLVLLLLLLLLLTPLPLLLLLLANNGVDCTDAKLSLLLLLLPLVL